MCRASLPLLLALLFVVPQAAGSDELPRRFREEVPQGWARLEEMETRLEFKVRAREVKAFGSGKRSVEETDIVCRQAPGCVLVEASRAPQGGAATESVVG